MSSTSDNLVDPHNKCFVERNDSGLYGSVIEQIKEMPNALSNLEYIGTKTRKPDFHRGVDWAKNIAFKEGPGKDAAEFRGFIIVTDFRPSGEIAEPIHGTLVSARGNHYDGRDDEPFKYIDDKTKVKDVLVLRLPPCAPWITMIKERFFKTLRIPKSFKTPLLAGNDLITITTQKKYGVPAAAGGPQIAVPAATPKRVARVKRKLGDDEEANLDDGGDSLPPPKEKESQIVIPEGKSLFYDEVKLGAFYDPRLLEDFGGPVFRFTKAILRQLDIRDGENRLIPAWKQYPALRPGSLVLACVSLHIAHTIRVLDESSQPVVRGEGGSHTPSTPSTPRKNTGVDLNNFVFTPRSSPTKKPALGNAGEEDDGTIDGAGPASTSANRKRRQGGGRKP
ncbi:hypothetical protein B0H14DRAFT_3159746 [Mycena olivaceomarginata]|nr:hypothetical protein B0H14DRAFT_3159746 [Mycena olivaceomarginata]